MKYLPIIIGVIVVIIFVYFGLLKEVQPDPTVNLPTTKIVNGAENWESKTDDQPPISIKVTPLELSPEADLWKFALTLETHSGDLNQDLAQITTLTDDEGNTDR